MTPHDVAMALASLGRDLDAAVRTLNTADKDAVGRREDYTMAHSKAFLVATGAMDLRKHQAIVDSHAERLAAETAEQIVMGIRRQIDSIKVRVDIGRSVNSALKTELAIIPGGAA
jgi:hypothetical protein